MPPHVMQAITGFRLVTQDSARLGEFYRAIGFAVGAARPIEAVEMGLLGLTGAGTRLPLTLGPSLVELDCFDTPGQPYPNDTIGADTVFQHLALITTDIAQAWARIQAAGAIAISRDGPVQLPASSGAVVAVKFRDPEGHPLELLQFPAGTNPAWPGAGLLGIDHSAVSVAAVDRSVAFYEAHGLTLGDRGLNQGPAQVLLDGIDSVVVDVVPLLPARTPAHVELLAYHGARGPDRAPCRPNDIAATRIVWQADRDALVRDPDGHLHQLISSAGRSTSGTALP